MQTTGNEAMFGIRGCAAQVFNHYSPEREALSAGDRVYLGDLYQPTGDEPIACYLLTASGYSDYSGGSYDASNHRSLLRDFPEVFIDVYGGYGTAMLALPADFDPSTNEDHEYVADILRKLVDDYPVYDEQDMSEYETELANDAWEQYLSLDVMAQLRELLGEDEELLDDSTEQVREWYYELTYEQAYGPEAESATSMTFPFNDAVCETIANRLRIARVMDA